MIHAWVGLQHLLDRPPVRKPKLAALIVVAVILGGAACSKGSSPPKDAKTALKAGGISCRDFREYDPTALAEVPGVSWGALCVADHVEGVDVEQLGFDGNVGVVDLQLFRYSSESDMTAAVARAKRAVACDPETTDSTGDTPPSWHVAMGEARSMYWMVSMGSAGAYEEAKSNSYINNSARNELQEPVLKVVASALDLKVEKVC